MSVFRKCYETAKDVTLAWFLDDDRTPALHRHVLNNRHQMDTKRKYTNMILQFGILTECRSEVVAVPGPLPANNLGAESVVYLFIAGATLVEAAYEAMKLQPVSPLMIRLRAEGLKGVTLLDRRTPDDALKWQKNHRQHVQLDCIPGEFS